MIFLNPATMFVPLEDVLDGTSQAYYRVFRRDLCLCMDGAEGLCFRCSWPLCLAYLIDRDYMQQFYSPKLYCIILMQSEDRRKENQNFMIISHDTLSSTDHRERTFSAFDSGQQVMRSKLKRLWGGNILIRKWNKTLGFDISYFPLLLP